MDLIVGIPLGILTSLVAWWIIFHGFMPRLTFSESIVKIDDSSSPTGFRYRVKLVNGGRRDILDVEFIARLSVTGMRERFPESISTLFIGIKGILRS